MPHLRSIAVVVGLVLVAGASAAERPFHAWSLTRADEADVLDARWADSVGASHDVNARFPAGSVTGAEPLSFDQRAIGREVVARLRAWAATATPDVQVELEGTEIVLSARGANPAPQVEAARAKEDVLYRKILDEHRLVRTGPGVLQFDVARLAADAAPSVRPLADAIGGAEDAREFATRALSLVQGIPYDAVEDDTFAAPLALLRLHHGDCDEKSALFLALMRSAEPTLPLVVFTSDAHAFVGIGLAAKPGERAVDFDGTSWLLAEPAGPAVAPLGTISDRASDALGSGGVVVTRVP